MAESPQRRCPRSCGNRGTATQAGDVVYGNMRSAGPAATTLRPSAKPRAPTTAYRTAVPRSIGFLPRETWIDAAV